MVEDILEAERQYLSRLLEAIQRCVYFLLRVSGRLIESCITDLGINPQSDDFTPEFSRIVIEFSAQ